MHVYYCPASQERPPWKFPPRTPRPICRGKLRWLREPRAAWAAARRWRSAKRVRRCIAPDAARAQRDGDIPARCGAVQRKQEKLCRRITTRIVPRRLKKRQNRSEERRVGKE